jgi:hypothetical protein
VLARCGPTPTHWFSSSFHDRQRVQRCLVAMRGGVVHRSRCWLDQVVSVWLDVLTRPRGGRRVSDGGKSHGSSGEGIGR